MSYILIGIGAGLLGAVAGIGAVFIAFIKKLKKKKAVSNSAEYATREKLVSITNALNALLKHAGMNNSQVATDLNRFDIDPEVRKRLIEDIKLADSFDKTKVSEKSIEKAKKTIKL